MQTMRETTTKVQRPGEFFNKLSPAALRDLESMEFPTLYQPGVLLFSEKSTPAGIFIVISGEVKLSINSLVGNFASGQRSWSQSPPVIQRPFGNFAANALSRAANSCGELASRKSTLES